MTGIKIATPEQRNGAWAVKMWDDEDFERPVLSATDKERYETATYYQAVAVLNRGVNLVCDAVASLPFEIRRLDSGDLVDSWRDYRNALGFLPNPQRLLWYMEASSFIYGAAYVWRERLGRRLVGLRPLAVETIKPEINALTGLTGFKRQLGATVKDVSVDDLIYFWRPDPHVEIGPPTSTPVKAALMAAGALYHLDVFVQQFFSRGAIRATLLTVDGPMPPESERQRLKSWWQRVISGIRNAFSAEVVSAAVKPVTIGDGLAELNNRSLTDTEREHIAVALGIPMSVLFSQTASGLGGGGVARQDDQHFYDKRVIPEAEMLAECLNEQLLWPLGYRLIFVPEQLSLYQEDERERAQSLALLVRALADPLADVALDILGYNLSDEQRVQLRAYWAQRQPQLQPAQPTVPSASQPVASETTPEVQPGVQPERKTAPVTDELRAALKRWERKAIKRLNETARAECDFVSDAIPPDVHEFVKSGLCQAGSVPDVKRLFAAVLDGANGQPEGETVGNHHAEFRPIPCPVCNSVGVDCYVDHGGLCVCRACEATFDPEVE